jgi:regulator of sigma D
MIFGLFKKKAPTSRVNETESVSASGIRYKPELINDLKQDHIRLLEIYTDIQLACEIKDFEKVANTLTTFRNELEDHLLKENINLYIYLSHLLKGDEMNSSLISTFRKEMDGIAKVALKFIVKYESIATDKNLHKEFAEELKTIGEVLGARIKREESVLYTLYAPPY